MKKVYILIENEKYKLKMSLETMNFDYYTDVCIELVFGKVCKILFEDNLLALKNIIKQYNKNVDVLDANLDENMLGILLNDYYRGLYENKFQDNLILDDQEQWIGEKYCCYLSLEFATWIYRYDGKIILKVTPIFRKFEGDNYIQEYYKFVQEYSDIFREEVTLRQLICAKKIIFELYDKLF